MSTVAILPHVFRSVRNAEPSVNPSKNTNRPDDGGRDDLRNVGKVVPDYTTLQPS